MMKTRVRISFTVLVMIFSGANAIAQIPVEVFAGHKKATVDIMFFRFIKNKAGHDSRFLFFNRNRAVIDYAMTKKNNLPQFGFTEACSYNHEKLKGFAPVVVAGILNSGLYPKAGIQFVKLKKDYTIFSWLVTETLKEPNVDFFCLVRYTPALSHTFNLFSQVEFVNTFPTVPGKTFSFAQRVRLGLKIKGFQFGAGLDFSQYGRVNFTTTVNIGGFIRYEF